MLGVGVDRSAGGREEGLGWRFRGLDGCCAEGIGGRVAWQRVAKRGGYWVGGDL